MVLENNGGEQMKTNNFKMELELKMTLAGLLR